MNMEDCPIHKVEKNPPYPFTCSCKADYTDLEWLNVASAEYHGWAAYGEYHAWVRESPEAHSKYVKMLWDYQLVYTRLYRKWLLNDMIKQIGDAAMTDRYEIIQHLKLRAEADYYGGEEEDDE